jgi:hypothetical protein
LIVVLLIEMVVLWEIGRFFRYIGNSTQSLSFNSLFDSVLFNLASGDKKLVANGVRVSPWIMCHGLAQS